MHPTLASRIHSNDPGTFSVLYDTLRATCHAVVHNAAKLREPHLSASMLTMSLSDLASPIKNFLRAVQDCDCSALHGALAEGAVLTIGDRQYSDNAISGWVHELSLRRIKTMRPINEAKRKAEIVVTMLTIESDSCGRDTEAMCDWHFSAKEEKILSIRMTRRPFLMLPLVVAGFVRAVNCLDLEALVASFTDDALVNDQLCDHRGKHAIHEWAAREITGERLTMFVVDAAQHRSQVVVTANINGSFDMRGLPDPLVLNFYFSLLGDQIEQLIILRKDSRA